MTDEESKRVDITFEAGKVTMECRGPDVGNGRVSMPLEGYDDGTMKIAFDPKFLAEYFHSLDGDEKTVTVMLNKPTHLAVFDSESSSYLIMPMGE